MFRPADFCANMLSFLMPYSCFVTIRHCLFRYNTRRRRRNPTNISNVSVILLLLAEKLDLKYLNVGRKYRALMSWRQIIREKNPENPSDKTKKKKN